MIKTATKSSQTDESLLRLDTPLQVLIAGNSERFCNIVRQALARFPNVEVIGTSCTSLDAMSQNRSLAPDLMILDVEMRTTNETDVLDQLEEEKSTTKVVGVNFRSHECHDSRKVDISQKAFDIIVTPNASDDAVNVAMMRDALKNSLHAFAEELLGHENNPNNQTQCPSGNSGSDFQACEIIVIGISTGGPEALMELIPRLPDDLPVPVLVVQHMPALYTKSFAERLNENSAISVSEANHLEPVLPGRVLIAPGGKQMKIGRSRKKPIIKITDDPAENLCKPSVDYLFRSVGRIYREKALGVIMTGMGTDGTESCRQLHGYGASLIAQDEESCVVYGMPRLIVEEGLVSGGTPLEEIAEEILRHVVSEEQANTV